MMGAVIVYVTHLSQGGIPIACFLPGSGFDTSTYTGWQWLKLLVVHF